MALKDWKKFQNSNHIQRWRHHTSLEEVRVAGPTKISDPVGTYFVELPRKATRFFKTKAKALLFAQKYMRSH